MKHNQLQMMSQWAKLITQQVRSLLMFWGQCSDTLSITHRSLCAAEGRDCYHGLGSMKCFRGTGVKQANL